MPPSALHRRLHENQLTLAAGHRGGLSRRADGVEILSTEESLRYVLLEAPLAEPLPEGCHCVRVMPWAGDVAQSLRAQGFEPQKDALLYKSMSLREPLPTPREIPGLELERARDPEAIEAFSDLLLETFSTSSPGPDRRRHLETQLRHAGDPSHFYMLGRIGGQPVVAALLLLTHDTAGIYGLATRTAFQRQGLGPHWVWRLAREALAAGCDVLGVQVREGAVSDRASESMGFRFEFRVTIYQRQRGSSGALTGDGNAR